MSSEMDVWNHGAKCDGCGKAIEGKFSDLRSQPAAPAQQPAEKRPWRNASLSLIHISEPTRLALI
eukprot:6908595-Alexandrium_andersonii.AAC.1